MNFFNRNTYLILTMLSATLVTITTSANEVKSSLTSNVKSSSTQLDIYKSPTCGCCGKWIKHMKEEGFITRAHNTNVLAQLKDEKGVPKNYRSCHTTISKDGYIFEGHIPAKIVKQFLQNKPNNSKGLVVPGMPVGTPGMEYQNKFMPYNVLSINKDGTLSTYIRINSLQEQF